MSFNAVVLVTFLAVIVVQAINRRAGAIAAIVWCLGLAAYGYWMFQSGAQIALLGVRIELWHFLTFMAAMLAYNTWVLVRALKAPTR